MNLLSFHTYPLETITALYFIPAMGVLCNITALLLLLVGSTWGQNERLSDIVDTDKGPVQGLRIQLEDDMGSVDRFLGIPFAKPPVGDLRFKHPEPNEPWEGIYNATKLTQECVQTGLFSYSEDCLYLDVYRPVTESPNKTVMVWIHGGGFLIGGTNVFDARYLATLNDVIVVSISYRLGAIGFLLLDDLEAPGNSAMFDQLMALQWVQTNIRNFGGDPMKVTIFGESAGGSSVGLHLISPLSVGLYSRAILESKWSPGVDWAITYPDELVSSGMALAGKLGCDTNADVSEIIQI